MEDVWLHILDHVNIQDTLRYRRISSNFDRICRKALRSRRCIDMEIDCPSAISDPKAIAHVINYCGSNVRELILRVRPPNEKYSVIPSSSTVTSFVIHAVAEKATKLTSLKIDRMTLTLGAIEHFGDLPETLEELRISNCLMSCSEWDVVTILKYSFEKMLNKCQKLRTFEISGRSLNYSQFHLDPSILRFLPQSIENLAIAVGCSLKIEHLNFLQDKKLKSLVLQRSFISSSSLDHLVDMADTLTHLDLSWSPNLLDSQNISKLYLLKYLSLSNNRDGVDDVALQKICQGCPDLEHLSIDQCSMLTPASLVYIGDLRMLKKLTTSGVINLDDYVCQYISKCRQLKFLDINFCKKISKTGLQCLLSTLNDLEHLEVLGIRSYSHKMLPKNANFPKTIVCDTPIQTFSFPLPPIPNTIVAVGEKRVIR